MHPFLDLTVYDYADSSRPQACARIKKGMSCNVIREGNGCLKPFE